MLTKNVSAFVSRVFKCNIIRVRTSQRQWYVLDHSKELKGSKIREISQNVFLDRTSYGPRYQICIPLNKANASSY